uniref:Uncharacterized protein n=1 Tax=Brassica oleracea var. oleracea TaxID=109376 RepID=A0A0D3ECV2_BRAOL
MTKKVNKTFIKPKRVEEVLLVKSGLLDEVNEETSGEGCSSVESDLEVDQEASNLELGHEVVCGTKEKEIERALGVDEEGLMVKKMTHDGSQVLNISWSKGSSTEYAYLMGEKIMVWCTSRGGEKHILCGSFQGSSHRSAMRRALDLTLAEKKMNLAEWALNCYKKGMLDQIVDPFLKGKITPECFKKFAEINRYEMCTRPGHRETVYGRCSVELRVRVAASGKRGREREGDMDPLSMVLASNLPDGSGRSFDASYSGSLQGLHNLHGSYNVGNMRGTLSSRNSSMNSIPSPGVQQPNGSFPVKDLIQVTYMLLSLSYLIIAHMGIPESQTEDELMELVVLFLGFSPRLSNRNSVPMGMSQLLANAGPRITSNAMGNMVGGGNSRNISSGGLSIPGLSSRLNLGANSGSGLSVQGQNRMLGGLPQGICYKLNRGDINVIMDPNLCGLYDTSSAWRALELAMLCADLHSTNRPTMSRVIIELKECLACEKSEDK